MCVEGGVSVCVCARLFVFFRQHHKVNIQQSYTLLVGDFNLK